MSRVEFARQQIEFARTNTLLLLEGLDEADWFRVPAGCPTHIAWQVGHLSMAMYMLTLFRMRGKADTDEAMIPRVHLKRYVKGSSPDPSPDANLPVAEMRRIFDAVYSQLMTELPQHPDEDFDKPVVMPYAISANKYGSLLFCAYHEMLHGGQIGLIRRLLGKAPIR